MEGTEVQRSSGICSRSHSRKLWSQDFNAGLLTGKARQLRKLHCGARGPFWGLLVCTTEPWYLGLRGSWWAVIRPDHLFFLPFSDFLSHILDHVAFQVGTNKKCFMPPSSSELWTLLFAHSSGSRWSLIEIPDDKSVVKAL